LCSARLRLSERWAARPLSRLGKKRSPAHRMLTASGAELLTIVD
jgi:hypothetical protein